jgi:hypothetical protein
VLAEGEEEGLSPSQRERNSKQGCSTRVLIVRFGIYRTHSGGRDAFKQFVELAPVQHSLIRFRRAYPIIRGLLRLIRRVGKGQHPNQRIKAALSEERFYFLSVEIPASEAGSSAEASGGGVVLSLYRCSKVFWLSISFFRRARDFMVDKC